MTPSPAAGNGRAAAFAWLAPVALFALLETAALLAPAWLPFDPLARPFETAGLLAAMTLAALDRPAGSGPLGLGTLALLPAVTRLGAAPAALLAAVAAVTAELARRVLERWWRDAPLPERRRGSRLAAQAALAGLGALAAGGVWIAAAAGAMPGAGTVAAAALAYLAPALLFEIATRRQRDETAGEVARGLLPLAGELPGFAVGALVLAVAAAAGWPLAAAWLAVAALLALEAARRELGAEAARRSLAAAVQVSRAGASLVQSSSELARLARRIFAESAAIVPFTYAHLELASPEGGSHSFWAGADGAPHEGEPDPPAYPPALPGFHRREPWRILDHRLLDRREHQARLRLWCDGRRLEPNAEASLAALVPQMTASLSGALLEREATTDRLTGAATRRALERRLVEAFDAARGEGGALAVVLCDLDHFKRINDTHGHAAGDRALQAAARVLTAPSRGADFCARYGGEEFVLVLEGTGGEAGLEIAERLRRRIEQLEVAAEGGPIRLSMSFGVAAYPELPVRTAEELVELADGALYTAKRLGRNLALLDVGGGRMRTGRGDEVEVAEAPPVRAPVFFA
ncbi:MAG: GGDEF domain-containing protein [Thermoanaerobaculia bacterium]|nr:GGDEF domain-containing protein [Thermoanaerobaculia bacterium]